MLHSPLLSSSWLLVCRPLTSTATHYRFDPSTVAMFVLAFVTPKTLFIQVPEQMKRFYRHVGSLQRPPQQVPEVLHPVRVDMTLDVLNGVIDNLTSSSI